VITLDTKCQPPQEQNLNKTVPLEFDYGFEFIFTVSASSLFLIISLTCIITYCCYNKAIDNAGNQIDAENELNSPSTSDNPEPTKAKRKKIKDKIDEILENES
jgi:hypothetical protein